MVGRCRRRLFLTLQPPSARNARYLLLRRRSCSPAVYGCRCGCSALLITYVISRRRPFSAESSAFAGALQLKAISSNIRVPDGWLMLSARRNRDLVSCCWWRVSCVAAPRAARFVGISARMTCLFMRRACIWALDDFAEEDLFIVYSTFCCCGGT